MANLDVIRPASCSRSTGGVSVHLGNRDSFHLVEHGQVQLACRSCGESRSGRKSDGSSAEVIGNGASVVGGRSRVRKLRMLGGNLVTDFVRCFTRFTVLDVLHHGISSRVEAQHPLPNLAGEFKRPEIHQE